MSITIFDVAALAGCSKSTVSRVFINPTSVPEATRKRVLDAAQELNYTPNVIARAMVRKKTENLAFIISSGQYPAVFNPFYSPVLEGVLRTSRKYGYSMLVMPDNDVYIINDNKYILKKQMDGVIAAGNIDVRLLPELKNLNIPTVLVNNSEVLDDFYSVSTDHYLGSVKAVEHLIACGYQKIGLIAGKFSPKITISRYNAFIETMNNHRIPIDYRYVQSINATVASAIHCVSEMLTLQEPPEALFCTNDIIAVGAIKAANLLHWKVPEDLAIIGFDDSQICTMMEPEITSIDVDTVTMGTTATEMLISIINGKKLPQKRVLVPSNLIVRKTTAQKSAINK